MRKKWTGWKLPKVTEKPKDEGPDFTIFALAEPDAEPIEGSTRLLRIVDGEDEFELDPRDAKAIEEMARFVG